MNQPSRRDFLRSMVGSGAAMALGGAAATRADSLYGADPAAEPARFRFVHLTDIHVQPELDAERGFRQCIAHVNALRPRPDFVITGGDLLMDTLSVDHQRAVKLWKIYDDCCRDFEMPVYNTIGNHDIVGWSSKAQVSPDHMDYGKKMFADHAGRGKVYASFDHGGWHFVLLDSIAQRPDTKEYVGSLGGEQQEWLLDDLAKAGPNKPIVFVTHIPFYSTYLQMALGSIEPPGEKSLVADAYKLRKPLLKYDLRLVLQGHIHVRERIDYGKISYIMSGAVSGNWWKGPTLGEHPEGYGVIDVKGTEFAYGYESFGWKAVKL
jgi:3',5'-cyclic-AMP phosphodiesterase